ncbi:glycosyltransferase [Mucilaginibacter sp.]|uniref:glycosyltransferase n=1 Tax=Mucilaginibacter sp. TaxID=1882438 RepID=UPI0026218774|nr:glycosyltransferase [Mucilaginibacter sp.]MDB5029910.1 glycosyltransferase [Mucilaginibacter sp.]
MDSGYTLCIIKPNKSSFSETFIQAHIERLTGNKLVLYGGAFPVYDNDGHPLIKSKWGLLSYLIQKKIFKRKNIAVRTNALKNYLLDKKVDVVFAEYGMVGAMVTQACQLANIPLIIHFHGADVHHKKTVAAYYELYQKAFKYASSLIAVSADMVESLKELGAPAGKIVNASCGVDTLAFPQLNILNSGRNFLFIGRFVEKKSPLSVVKAFKQVAEKFPDAKLWMVGQGPLFKKTKALITQLQLEKSVTLLGVLNTAQIKELFAKTRCFVQHSVTADNGDKEGTPVTILEAGSSGLAIVSTQHAGIKEAVLNGEPGDLVPEHDVEGMARYMIKIADDVGLASLLGTKEAAHIRANYDIRDRIDTLNTVIQQAIKKNKDATKKTA